MEIGRRLAQLASRHQVIVVTHLPQVAAYADRHLVVQKASGAGVTRSSVRRLTEEERTGELARMLAGMDDTDTGRAHAEELLSVATAHREADRAAARPADLAEARSRRAQSRRGRPPQDVEPELATAQAEGSVPGPRGSDSRGTDSCGTDTRGTGSDGAAGRPAASPRRRRVARAG